MDPSWKQARLCMIFKWIMLPQLTTDKSAVDNSLSMPGSISLSLSLRRQTVGSDMPDVGYLDAAPASVHRFCFISLPSLSLPSCLSFSSSLSLSFRSFNHHIPLAHSSVSRKVSSEVPVAVWAFFGPLNGIGCLPLLSAYTALHGIYLLYLPSLPSIPTLYGVST